MFVQVGLGVGCVVLYYASPLCLDFVGVCAGGIGCGLCCVVLCVSFVFGFCWLLHLVRIMVSIEM